MASTRSGLQINNKADKLHVQPDRGFNDSPFPQLEQKLAFSEAREPQQEQNMTNKLFWNSDLKMAANRVI